MTSAPPCCVPIDLVPDQRILLFTGPRHSPWFSWGAKVSSLTAWRIIHTSQSHHPAGWSEPGIIYLILLLLWSLPAMALSYSFFPSAAPTWACAVQCPPPSGSQYMWLKNCCQSHLPSATYCVFSHCYKPGAEILPSSTRWKAGNQNTVTFNHYKYSLLWATVYMCLEYKFRSHK